MPKPKSKLAHIADPRRWRTGRTLCGSFISNRMTAFPYTSPPPLVVKGDDIARARKLWDANSMAHHKRAAGHNVPCRQCLAAAIRNHSELGEDLIAQEIEAALAVRQ